MSPDARGITGFYCSSIYWEAVYKVSCSWADVLIVYSLFYLECWIWSDRILPWIIQRNSECVSDFVPILENRDPDYD
jgi:hypothetical protein